MRLLLLIFLAVLARATTAGETPLVDDTPEAACTVLQKKIATLSKVTGKPDALFFNDTTTTENEYFYVMALRSRQSQGASGEIYSNLVGWFAVARRSNVVLEWDIGENRLVEISDAYSRSKPDKEK